jgi:hypothetical protein
MWLKYTIYYIYIYLVGSFRRRILGPYIENMGGCVVDVVLGTPVRIPFLNRGSLRDQQCGQVPLSFSET